MLGAAAGSGVAQTPAAPTPAASTPRTSTGPAWKTLDAAERQALAPLAAHWSGLSEAHKRKWIALARNFDRLPSAEQARLHSRMTEWAALSPQDRSQARLNFAETQQLSSEEKKAKWEAYQALSPEERRKLAQSAAPRPPATAAPARPVPADKLTPVPKSAQDSRPVRIATPVAPTLDPLPRGAEPTEAASAPPPVER